MELLPQIHLIEGVSSNAYLIVEPDGLTVIDTGLPGSAPNILAYIRQIGRDPHEVRHLLLTHQHIDHVGGAAALAAATGAEVIAHPLDTPAIEGKGKRELAGGFRRPLLLVMVPLTLKPVRVSHQVRDGETLPILTNDGQFQVVETPGHTSGHMSFYLPARRLLFVGDAYRHEGERITEMFPGANTDTAQARHTVAEVAKRLDIEASLPGHGQPILTGAGAKLAELTKTLSR